jgi:protein TonB
MPPAEPQQAVPTPEATAREERRRQLIALLAEIERRVNEENARPKKRYISPATREEVYAIYYDTLRRRIEDRGTQNFPELAGRKLYGELTMAVTVNHDGRVLDTEVAETSGNLTLDRRAMAIARASGPFSRFNDAMRRTADQIVVVSRFKFTRDETLETNLMAR